MLIRRRQHLADLMAIEFLRTQRHRRHPMRKLQTITVRIGVNKGMSLVQTAVYKAARMAGVEFHANAHRDPYGQLALIADGIADIPATIAMFPVTVRRPNMDPAPDKCPSQAAEWVIAEGIRCLEIFGLCRTDNVDAMHAWVQTYTTEMLIHLDRAGGLQHTRQPLL